MKFSKTIDALPHQQGAALFMALIMLLVLTILGVFGMNMSRLENLMAGNAQFQTTALNNAEYALSRGVEDWKSVSERRHRSSLPRHQRDRSSTGEAHLERF
jgi:Tfp pilus assembly protein PilX